MKTIYQLYTTYHDTKSRFIDFLVLGEPNQDIEGYMDEFVALYSVRLPKRYWWQDWVDTTNRQQLAQLSEELGKSYDNIQLDGTVYRVHSCVYALFQAWLIAKKGFEEVLWLDYNLSDMTQDWDFK